MGKRKTYNSETGDVIEEGEQQGGVIPVEPLRIPGRIDQFLNEYIPAPSPCKASEWLTYQAMRDYFGCNMPYGAKKDPLQEVIDELSYHGFTMTDTGCGVYMCVTKRTYTIDITPYQTVEEI